MLLARRISPGYADDKIFNKLSGIGNDAEIHCDFALVAAMLNYGLSLTDPLWLNPKEKYEYNEKNVIEPTTYDKINFYDNPYPQEIGEITIGANDNAARTQLRYYAPELTTGGRCNKRWMKFSGKNFLYKRKEQLSETELAKAFAKKKIRYKLANLNNALIPEIIPANKGWLTSCLCDKGSVLFSNEQLCSIFAESDPTTARRVLAKRFDAEYIESEKDIIPDGILIKANGKAYDAVW